MNQAEFTSVVNGINDKRLDLLLFKSQDYATEDKLANFKRMNKLCEILGLQPMRSAGDCALFLLLLKLDRLCNLKNKNTEPKNESVKDTIMDAHNYLDLYLGCEMDKPGKIIVVKPTNEKV